MQRKLPDTVTVSAAPNLQLKVNRSDVLDMELDAGLHDAFKAVLFEGHTVDAGNERGDEVDALVVA